MSDDLKKLRERLRNIVSTYERRNPLRTADFHGEDCACYRCAVDACDAAVNALPELLALREENARMREALQKIAKGKYGKCPIEGHWPPEKPCTLCGDLGFFDDDPKYNPAKDGHCVEGGARVVARAALNQEPAKEDRHG